MDNANNISLSQDEVDRLLGRPAVPTQKKEAPAFKRETIATDAEIAKFGTLMDDFSAILKKHLKDVFSEQGIRKLTPSATEQISRAEFMTTISDNDFLFLVEIEKHEILIKFDSFLFCSLAGISFNINHKTNMFQNEVIRTVITPMVIDAMLKAAHRHEPKNLVRTTPLFDLPELEGLKTETPGISASFTWNEGFKSLGIEKFFFQKDFLDFLLAQR